MKKKPLDYFKGLTAEQIANEPLNKWGDYELLSVWGYFAELDDGARQMAALELILNSIEYSEMVDYTDLYHEIARHYLAENNYEQVYQWLYAAIACEEQHELADENRLFWQNAVAETHLYTGALNSGIVLFTRSFQLQPGKPDTFNLMALALADVGLNDLALELLDRAFVVAELVGEDGYTDEWQELRAKATADAESSPSRLGEVDTAVLTALRAAIALPPPDDYNDDNAPQPYLPAIAHLGHISDDDPLFVEILTTGKLLVPELIRLAYDSSSQAGARQAVTLLRRMRDEKTAELQKLSAWLDKANDHWQQTLSPHIGKIGGFTIEELKTIAADTSYHLYVRTEASKTLAERVLQSPALRQPTIDFFRHLLNRPEAHDLVEEETFIGFLVGDIQEADLRELYPDIQAAFLEDRVDPQITDLAFIEEKWGLPITIPQQRPSGDAMMLLLQCAVCHRQRIHFVRYILIDALTLEKKQADKAVEFDAHIMDHEIICPKCGASDQYNLTPEAYLALIGPQSSSTIMDMVTDKEPTDYKPNPRLHYFKSYAFGVPMHPFKAVQRYQQLIANQPNDALLHMRLGVVFLTAVRYEKGLMALRRAYQLAPKNLGIVLRLAMAEHDFGDRVAAKRLYEQVYSLTKGKLLSEEMMEHVALARDGLRGLAAGEPSPHELPLKDVMLGAKQPSAPKPPRKKQPKKRRR